MISESVQWFERNVLFSRSKALPMLGYRYRHHTTTVFGIVPFNTGGFAITQNQGAGFGFVKFTQPSLITRVELTISVRANTNNAYIGAFVMVDPPASGTQIDFTGNKEILLGNVTNNEEAVISKNFYLGAFAGYSLDGNQAIGLAVVGDNTGICGVNLNYHWIDTPGRVLDRNVNGR